MAQQTAYFKVGNNYYEMKTKECTSVNVQKKSISKVENLPTASMRNVTVISKEEFDLSLSIVMDIFNNIKEK
jgi:hypothetical protein